MTSGEGPIKASPACSTFLENSAFSAKKPYLRGASNTSVAGAYRDMKHKDEPRMDHVHAVLEGNTDDIILSEISSHRCKSLSDLVCFVGLDSRA